jgi:tetratricopeptide (TPR) repeat protein
VVAFSPDGHRLAAGCPSSVVIYELAERLGRQLPGHRLFTLALAVHPRKPLLASASRQCVVSLEDLVTGEELRRWNFAGLLGRLAFSPDGRMLAVAPFATNPTYQFMGNKDVYLVDTENGKTRKLDLGDVSAAVAFDSAGRLLAVGHQSGAVTVCNAESGETVHRWQSTNGWISEVALCRGGQLLVGEVGGSLRLCDMVDGRTIRELRLPRGLFRFVVDPTEQQVAAVDLFGTVRILKLPDLQQVGTIDRSDGVGQVGFVGLGFSGDGRWLAIGGADRRVSIYDARTLRRMIQLPTQNGAVYDVAFQRHGSGLAQGGADEMLSFWDLSRIELALAANGLGWEGAALDGVPGTSQTGPAPRVRLERGWGKRDETINWYLEQVLKTNPDQADLAMELAWVQVMGPTKFRNATKALPLARRAVALAPDEPLCLNTLGVVYYRLGQWKEAADTLQASAQTNPEGPSAYDLFFLAMAFRQTGQPAKAKDCYDQALRWCRAHGNLAHHQPAELLAIRAEAEGLLDRAAKAEIIAAAAPQEGVLEKLAERAASDAQFQAELARHFAERGNAPLAQAARTKARKLFEEKLAKEPENSTWAAELADVLLIDSPGQWTILLSVSGAPAIFDPAIFARERDRFYATKITDPWAKLAAAYHVLGDQQALDSLLKHHPEASSRIADVYRAAGRTREAIPHLAKASAANPNDTLLSLKVAALQAWFGQEKELAATRQRILAFAKDTDGAGTAEHAAKACSIRASTSKAELDAALALARKGVELQKGNSEWREWRLLALGMAEYRSGHDAAAVEALLAAAKDCPSSPHAIGTSAFYRALSLYRQGKHDEARRLAIESAAQMKPLAKDEQNPLPNDADPWENDWEDDLILWLAYKEAKAMIHFDAPPAAPVQTKAK